MVAGQDRHHRRPEKLFFNLRRIKGQIRAVEDGDLSAEQVERIADELNVPEDEVVSMNRRMAGGITR